MSLPKHPALKTVGDFSDTHESFFHGRLPPVGDDRRDS
jgi:hypothetical protein